MNINSWVKDVLKESKEINEEFHFFNVICEDKALEQAEKISQKKERGKLVGIAISVKDCVCVKGVESTAGSKILKGYKPLFDATLIQKIKSEDGLIIGKTSQDAFGFGSFNTNIGLDYETPKNPHDKERATGGSSGGAAGITAKATFKHVAIAESTGGSIENPASFCGVVGFCPTYGRISRYGLISYANSLDKIGLMSKRVEDLIPVLEVISGSDPKDGTSLRDDLDVACDKKKFKIGIIKESLTQEISKEVKESFGATITKLKETHDVSEVSLPITFKYGVPTYYIISTSEASTNLAKLSGLRFGQQGAMRGKSFSEYFSMVRSENFNTETKRRILLGTFTRLAGTRDAYYIKATKARTIIIEEYKKLFETYDILISPTMPFVAPKFDEIAKMTPVENYLADVLTVGPNLAGIPHASIPLKTSGLPIGMMAMSDHLQEGTLLKFLQIVEDLQ